MENKDEKNRFTYSSDEGLSVLTEEQVLEMIENGNKTKESSDNKISE